MRALFSISLGFLFIAACMGLFMRYQLIAPTPGINFAYFVHGHSHVMFLGWVFNVLYLAFVREYTPNRSRFTALFWTLQAFVAGMLISFPLQGYGLYSILFSTLHTFGVFFFIVWFFRSTRGQASLALLLARAALLFFALSSAGPFSLGYLKASGHEHSNIYRFAIYFYLHFQYNGFFLLGVLSLLIKSIEHQLLPRDLGRIKTGVYLLIGACIPTYLLSTLWAEPGYIYNIIGFLFALIQLMALLLLIKPFKLFLGEPRARHTRILLACSLSALFIKCALQVMSAYPPLALLADEYRSIVITYLHLVLLGFVSFFLIGWMEVKGLIAGNIRKPVALILFGFIGSEAVLGIMPWSDALLHTGILSMHKAILLLSAIMVVATAWITWASFKKSHPQKTHSHYDQHDSAHLKG